MNLHPMLCHTQDKQIDLNVKSETIKFLDKYKIKSSSQ